MIFVSLNSMLSPRNLHSQALETPTFHLPPSEGAGRAGCNTGWFSFCDHHFQSDNTQDLWRGLLEEGDHWRDIYDDMHKVYHHCHHTHHDGHHNPNYHQPSQYEKFTKSKILKKQEQRHATHQLHRGVEDGDLIQRFLEIF